MNELSVNLSWVILNIDISKDIHYDEFF